MIAFASAAARNGLTGVPVNAGERYYSYSSGDLYPLRQGSIFGAACITAAIANFNEWRFHKKTDPNWNRMKGFVRDQTGDPDLNNIAWLNYPITPGDTLVAEADNGNNSQLETILLLIAKGAIPKLSLVPPGTPPPGAMLVQVSGSQTLRADEWTNCALTFSYNLDRTKKYKILGAMFHSATGHAWRLNFKDGPNKEDHPGFICGDTNIANYMIYGDIGEFSGLNPPSVEILADAADTAQEGVLLIKEL